jgi:tRNA (mo5U34)-methyltransferase
MTACAPAYVARSAGTTSSRLPTKKRRSASATEAEHSERLVSAMTETVAIDVSERIREIPVWFHSIELAPGIWTPGHKSPDVIGAELRSLRLPPIDQKTVLDIGAFDGFFSFAVEKLGASRVVALDHFVWSMDLKAHMAHYEGCRARGVAPEPYETMPYWQPETLPGKRGFDLAKDILGSRVEDVVGDFMAMDLSTLGGPFDIVLLLGVLYHMEHPMLALERAALLTKPGGVCVIETEALNVPKKLRDLRLVQFFDAGELNADASNWWAPNASALEAMCRRAGFSRAYAVTQPPKRLPLWRRVRSRVAERVGVRPKRPSGRHYRLVAHAIK